MPDPTEPIDPKIGYMTKHRAEMTDEEVQLGIDAAKRNNVMLGLPAEPAWNDQLSMIHQECRGHAWNIWLFLPPDEREQAFKIRYYEVLAFRRSMERRKEKVTKAFVDDMQKRWTP